MSRVLEKQYAISEGLGDYCEHQGEPVAKDALPADIARIAFILTNGLPQEIGPEPDIAWIGRYSVGGRWTDAEKVGEIDPALVGEHEVHTYDGYDPKTGTVFGFESATSGASLVATRPSPASPWSVEFRDPRERSSVYRKIWRALGSDALRMIERRGFYDWREISESQDG